MNLKLCSSLLLFALCICISASTRKDLSTIRYRFTPCGVTGRTGPTAEQCEEFHGNTESLDFRESGVQVLNFPRTTLYNFTVAGASGGRGVCNTIQGRGVIVAFQAMLSEAHQLVIVVGQKGGSPCDETSLFSGLNFCHNETSTFNEISQCQEDWLNYVNTNYSDYNDSIGGGGGGGASVIVPRIGEGTTGGIPLAIAGGGGGTSAILQRGRLCNVLGINCNRRTVLTEEFRNGTNGRYTFPNNFTTPLNRGRSGQILNNSTAGAGGGWNPRTETRDVDGEAFDTLLAFESITARGGVHCTNDDTELDLPFSDGFGGFGGGGGGCGGGGGGGGFQGGNVNGAANMLGQGGSSQVLIGNIVHSSVVQFRLNNESEDGFVEIIPADCNCVYKCNVSIEDDMFECLCPDGASLALDGNDCYKSIVQEVFEYSDPDVIPPAMRTTGAGFNIAVYSLGTTVQLYSMEATLSGVTSDSNGEQSCAIVFFSEEEDTGGNVLLLTSYAVSNVDGGTVTTLSRVVVGTLEYGDTLDSPFLVSGAVLLSTGGCVIEDMSISMNISIQSSNSSEGLDLMEEQYRNIFQALNTTNLPRKLLQLGERPTSPSPSGTPPKAGIAIITVFSIVVLVMFILIIVIICVKRHRRRAKNTSASNKEVELNTLSVQQQQDQIDDATKNAYETVDFGNEDIHGYAQLTFQPRFGISAPEHDFHAFNRQRSDTVIAGWNYPRSKLMYMREIGEGQFGKVLLMKAQGIAGYTGKIPVAVKTLTSQDPEVVRKFMDEAELMKMFSHPNIVSLLGICSRDTEDVDDDDDEDSAPLMILEYMQYGDLQAFLESHKLGIDDILLHKFARDITSAMEFLDHCKFVHRDLAARNCLVGSCLRIKIADFGLARGVRDKDYYRVAGKAVLPVRWMAPECLLYGVFTTASDVWAYGVVLWELMTYGDLPFDNLEVQQVIQKAQDGTLKHSKPENAPEDMYEIMCFCHKHEANQRPSFSEIAAMLARKEEAEEEERDNTDRDDSTTFCGDGDTKPSDGVEVAINVDSVLPQQ